MTNESTSTETPKKSNKKTIIVTLLIVGLAAIFDYSQTNFLLGKGECNSNDSTSVTPVAVDTIVPTPVVVAVDTTKVDTTKK